MFATPTRSGQAALPAHRGKPLVHDLRRRMEQTFHHDFSRVRIHQDGPFAQLTRPLRAAAITVDSDIALAPMYRDLSSSAARKVIAHELAHVVQQQGGETGRAITNDAYAHAEEEASAASAAAMSGTAAPIARASVPAGTVQMQPETPFKAGSVRSPAFEELVTQQSTIMGGLQGSPLTTSQRELAQTIFGNSIDYSRVRLLSTAEPLWFRTVGNVIRVPPFFTVDASVTGTPLSVDYMRHTFIHEMTHVWQYQHAGTSYISHALAPQIGAMVKGKSRNAAYCYEAKENKSFWDFSPEQQGLIVENTFLMRVHGHAILCGPDQDLELQSDPKVIGQIQPIHEKYVAQMQAALPKDEADLLMQRNRDVMTTPGERVLPPEPSRQLAPLKPLLQLTF